MPFEYLEELETLSDKEYGRLGRALIRYSRDGIPIPTDEGGGERHVARMVMAREDRFQKGFEENRARKSKAGKAGARKRWKNDSSEMGGDNRQVQRG